MILLYILIVVYIIGSAASLIYLAMNLSWLRYDHIMLGFKVEQLRKDYVQQFTPTTPARRSV